MNTESSIFSMELNFSNQNKAGTGYLLSMDEVELVKNMGRSLKNPEDRDFLYKIADKEFITTEEKNQMHQIFTKAADRIKKEASLSI